MFEQYKFLIFGASGAGKTEAGLRMLKAKGTSGASTIFMNSFSTELHYLPYEDNPKSIFFSRNNVIGSMIDISGQLAGNTINFEMIAPELVDCNGGIVYIIDSANPDFNYINKIDNLITQRCADLGISKPKVSVYVSKAMVNDSLIDFNDVIVGDYKTLMVNNDELTIDEFLLKNYAFDNNLVIDDMNLFVSNKGFNSINDYLISNNYPSTINDFLKLRNYSSINELLSDNNLSYTLLGDCFNLCSKLNAPLFVGDSIGENINEPIADIYLIKGLSPLDLPLKVNVDAILSINVLLKKALNKMSSSVLEPSVIPELIKNKICSISDFLSNGFGRNDLARLLLRGGFKKPELISMGLI